MGDGNCWGMVGNGYGLHNRCRFAGLAYDCVESVDGIGSVVHGATGAIGFNEGVLKRWKMKEM